MKMFGVPIAIVLLGVTILGVHSDPTGVCGPQGSLETSPSEYFPDDKDCTIFYQCVWGTPTLMQCPSGLHFNPTLNVCDWPYKAGCTAGAAPPPPPHTRPPPPPPTAPPPPPPTAPPPPPPTAPPPTAPPPPPATLPCPAPGSATPVPAGTCPSSMPLSHAWYLADAADSTRFFQCVWGKPELLCCPPDLHWNTTLNTCAYH